MIVYHQRLLINSILDVLMTEGGLLGCLSDAVNIRTLLYMYRRVHPLLVNP